MRLFVALNLPEAVRTALWEAAGRLRATDLPVKWVAPEGLHVTLKFLGEVPPEREPELVSALARARVGARPLPLAVNGFGAFPDARHPRVVWAGVTPDPALELLQHGVEREFAPLGFPTEGRAFRPHVTLGRAARETRARDFLGLGAALDTLAFEANVVISTVDLMRSTPQSGGAVYHPIHRERLV